MLLPQVELEEKMEKAFGEAMAKSATGEKKLPKSLYQTLINSVWCARAPVPHRPLPRVVLLLVVCSLLDPVAHSLCVCAFRGCHRDGGSDDKARVVTALNDAGIDVEHN